MHSLIFLQQHDSDLLFFEVHGDAIRIMGKHDQFAVAAVLQAIDIGNAIADPLDLADFINRRINGDIRQCFAEAVNQKAGSRFFVFDRQRFGFEEKIPPPG